MPRKNQGCKCIGGGGGGGGGTSKRQKTSSYSNSNREDSPPPRDDFSRILRSELLPRGYPMPTTFSGGMHLVNTFEDCFENLDGYNEEHANIKLLASRVSQSIVSLASFKGRTRLFTCTGTIVECMPSGMSILTSASLVRCSKHENNIVGKSKIKVRLPNGKLVQGKLWNYDLNYNIAVVNIRAFSELRAANIHNQVQANDKCSQSKVVAFGRVFESGELMATGGMLLYKNSKLDCQELMTSTCKITKAGIGGPLIGSGGNFVGMSFYSKDGAPFLPISILLKCLNHFNIFGRVVQPWLGVRIGSLQAEKLGICEEVHGRFPHAHGVYVERVFDGSPAADSGIKVGDVITKLDEVALFHAQEFHMLILDKTETTLQHGEGMHFEQCPTMQNKRRHGCLSNITFEVSVLRPSDGFEFIATINAEVINMSQQNRWPVPKTEWFYPSMNTDYLDELFWP